MNISENIIALSTPPGKGAIGVVRLSGKNVIEEVDRFFEGKQLSLQKTHTLHFGKLIDESKNLIDEVVVGIFKAPRSYTGENVVEISCHGSPYIVEKIITLFLDTKRVSYAHPGAFTQRAFLNGKLDLVQAEAVADLIESDNAFQHQSALKQLRDGFSKDLTQLREKLIHFASLLELELDFSEEDVEFADRQEIKTLVLDLKNTITKLLHSFRFGNVIKKGVAVAIVGKPNAGKSTLLNALLNEEKAIVSDIPGTTRDLIEDQINIQGIHFRFTDTAGLRQTGDKIEQLGIKKTQYAMEKADIILHIFDLSQDQLDIPNYFKKLEKRRKPFLLLANKVDLCKDDFIPSKHLLSISAKEKKGIEKLKTCLVDLIKTQDVKIQNTVITNARHYENLKHTISALEAVLEGIDRQITSDFLALDLRNALRYLGEITGEITTDDLLDTIFSKFCIGK